MEREKEMEFEKYIHKKEELLKLFKLIDDKYDNWTEEQDSGITVSLDEFYHEKGFIDFEDFSITKMMYDMTNNQIAINKYLQQNSEIYKYLQQNSETNNDNIEKQRDQILCAKIEDLYENIRISLNSSN